MLVDNTPIQVHKVDGRPVLVKREDLCCPYPGPSFSKMRGVVAHISKQEAAHIGVLDTFHSKAGWAVSWACHHLGKQCVNFWPRYKDDPTDRIPRAQQRMSLEWGAKLVAVKAGRSAILYHAAKKHMKAHFPGSYVMPNALKLPESVEETAAEVERTKLPNEGTLVVSISSGTIAAGVLKGFEAKGILGGYQVILHMGYSRPIEACRLYMAKKAGVNLDHVEFIDERFGYKDAVEDHGAPFPCNPHYDGKTWRWLTQHIKELGEGPIVFWNIGE